MGLTFDGGVESSLVGPLTLPVTCGTAPTVAGTVQPLVVAGKVAASEDISLAWPEGGSDYYAIYQGTLGGVFDTHLPLTCGTIATTGYTFTPNPQSSYYLVTPIKVLENPRRPIVFEGSYGQSSFGQRPRSTSPCAPHPTIAECPD